jgi:hypothetical protein
VATTDPTLGKIIFSCSGLPSGAVCSFNPISLDPAVTPGPTNLTASISAVKGTAALMAPARSGTSHAPLYAMLAFPVFGVVLAGFGAQRKKGTARWAVLAMLGLMLLLAMAGCGVAPPPPPTPGTPAGTSVVTVTATSAGFTATTTFNLVVQ